MAENKTENRTERRVQQQKSSPKNKKIWIGVLSVVLVSGIAVLGYMLYQRHLVKELLAEPGIHRGVTIEGEDVSGLSVEEAVDLLQNKYKVAVEDEAVTLYFGEDEEWEYAFPELGAGYQLAEAVDKAYHIGRSGEEKEDFQMGKVLLKDGVDIEVDYGYDKEMMGARLDELVKEFNRDAKNSTLTRTGGKFIIEPEVNGRKMNREETQKGIASVLDSRKSGKVQIEAEVENAAITAEDNSHVTDLIGSFQTTYKNNDQNRNTNLVVGCRNINGTVIPPGGVFSANESLGSQTVAGGYREAAIYNNGKVEQGIAGGVCQVTTTLYNAAIQAELDIVERHPHSMTVGYVPLGRDAAVAGTYKDLKFKNNTEYPIYIEAYAANGNLVMNIYGHEVHAPGRKVSYETVYESTVPKPAEVVTKDPNLPEGERKVTHVGKTGSKVSVYKVVTQNGQRVGRDLFNSSSYRATADEVSVGTKKPEAKAEQNQEEKGAQPEKEPQTETQE